VREAERRRRDDLAATSESISEDARRIERLESKKRSLDPTDPVADTLSIEVEELAAGVARKSRMERHLAADDLEADGTAKPTKSN
jgi:hypothetical protein